MGRGLRADELAKINITRRQPVEKETGRGPREARELLYGRPARGSGPADPPEEINPLTIPEAELHDMECHELLEILSKLNERADPPDQNFAQVHSLEIQAQASPDVNDLIETQHEIIDAIIDMRHAIQSNEPPYGV